MGKLGLLMLAILAAPTDGGGADDPVPELPPPAALIAPPEESAPVQPPQVPDACTPCDKPDAPPKPWCGGVELGVNGTNGNSELLKLRSAGNVKRETQGHLWKFDTLYNYARASGIESENRAFANSRYERLFVDTPWSTFVSGSLEYDEFTAYHVLLAGHTGVACQCWKTDWTKLKTWLGAGASQRYGGPENHIRPEAVSGIEVEQKLRYRQKLCGSAVYYPNVSDWQDFRMEAKVAYEVLVDPDWNLTLKLGMLNRYISQPEGKKPNDVEYFGVLLWKF